MPHLDSARREHRPRVPRLAVGVYVTSLTPPPSSSLLKHLLNGEAGAAAEWQQQNGRTLAGGLACQHLTAAVHSRSRWTVHASSHHLKPALHRHFDCAGVWVRPGCDLPPRTGRVSTLLLKTLSQQWSHPAQRTL